VDANASKEKEEGVDRVVDHARDLCTRARVDDAGFEAVKGDRGDVKRDATVGRGGGGGGADLASTTTIRSSNDNPIVAGSDLDPAVFFKSILVSAGNN
jgi:hypothetical protein